MTAECINILVTVSPMCLMTGLGLKASKGE